MKKYNKIILLMMLGVFLSCSESFLELTPKFAVSDVDAMDEIAKVSEQISNIIKDLKS